MNSKKVFNVLLAITLGLSTFQLMGCNPDGTIIIVKKKKNLKA